MTPRERHDVPILVIAGLVVCMTIILVVAYRAL